MTQNQIDVTQAGIVVYGAWALVEQNGITAGTTAITVWASPGANISGNTIPNAGHIGAGILVDDSDEALVKGNEIISPTVGINIINTVAVSVTDEVSNPDNAGIVVIQDERAQVDRNTVTDNNTLGIHYQSGVDAVLANNTVTSIGDVGIRLGTGAAGCPIVVDNILVQDNLLTGGALGIEVLCDVGNHTLIGN